MGGLLLTETPRSGAAWKLLDPASRVREAALFQLLDVGGHTSGARFMVTVLDWRRFSVMMCSGKPAL
jgi:hypothetical protein